MTNIKTFKGISADDKLTEFINTVKPYTYQIKAYHGKVSTKERMIKIEYLKRDQS